MRFEDICIIHVLDSHLQKRQVDLITANISLHGVVVVANEFI